MVQLELIHMCFLLATLLFCVMLTLPMNLWVLKSMVLAFLIKKRAAEWLESLHLKFFTRRNMMLMVEILSSSLMDQLRASFTHFVKYLRNHRMTEVRMDLWRSPAPTLLQQ